MTHAHVTPNTPILCTVEFDYSPQIKDAVKELAGSNYANSLWTLPIMHLPTLKTIFATLTVDPAVVTAYHALLRKMLRQLEGQHRKGAMGKAIADLLDKHAVGIAAVYKSGWTPTERPQTQYVPTLPPTVQPDRPTVNVSKGEQLWFNGVQNAAKAKERKAAIVRNVRGKRKKVTA
jgi:hypothetical protein